jgi:hypothetical protein
MRRPRVRSALSRVARSQLPHGSTGTSLDGDVGGLHELLEHTTIPRVAMIGDVPNRRYFGPNPPLTLELIPGAGTGTKLNALVG